MTVILPDPNLPIGSLLPVKKSDLPLEGFEVCDGRIFRWTAFRELVEAMNRAWKHQPSHPAAAQMAEAARRMWNKYGGWVEPEAIKLPNLEPVAKELTYFGLVWDGQEDVSIVIKTRRITIDDAESCDIHGSYPNPGQLGE